MQQYIKEPWNDVKSVDMTYTYRQDTTIAPLGKSASLAPGLVRPRHITFAPLKRNLIAPLSTC